MSELEAELKRVTFFGLEADGELVGVMGLEPVKDTTLIRHAYVLTEWQRQGISARLLEHIKPLVGTERLLVGTWADATWAIKFYEKHGFKLLPDKDELLKRYWDIPQRQIETSVVMGMEMG
jgi:GNAT superfamily N-acetyltransferase